MSDDELMPLVDAAESHKISYETVAEYFQRNPHRLPRECPIKFEDKSCSEINANPNAFSWIAFDKED